MCRVLGFLGEPVALADLLFNPSSSLINQTYNPHFLHHMLNLGGFGMCVWSKDFLSDQCPMVYKTTELPFYDKNLESLSNLLRGDCVLAHIRGVVLSNQGTISNENVHPFIYPGFKLALAHNGTLTGLDQMKPALCQKISPAILPLIKGSTDTEWIYALLMSQFKDPRAPISKEEAKRGLLDAVAVLVDLRRELGIDLASPLNLFLSNGQYMLALRYVANYGNYSDEIDPAHLSYHSMWYTFGDQYGVFDGHFKMQGHAQRKNLIISSEPLTDDISTWLEMPEYSMTTAWREGQEVKFMTEDI